MRIVTKKAEFDARFAWVPSRMQNELFIDIDSRKTLGEIAASIEGNAEIESYALETEKTVFAGYTELAAISRDERTGIVHVKLKQP